MGKRPRGLILTLVINWLIKPFTMVAIAAFFLGALFKGFIGADAVDLVKMPLGLDLSTVLKAAVNLHLYLLGASLLFGALVIGGFFQIQTLQKIPQIGMLKAIGGTGKQVIGIYLVLVAFYGALALFVAVPVGMGLAYVQTLVRRHNGRIWCESELGKGTTMTFTISPQRAAGGDHVAH